ncbi:MAG TPA: GntR family transcriptional regulator [Oscillospiraceae bacterium]|jgi:GntR family transcriptional regulator|nr:GntR family transcriptional regulator [Oscillospiraceae bacterium]
MKLDKHSSIPLYAQLRELIVERIQDNSYKQGERIPSEMQLCEELDLSRPTVRQAISELVSDGILEIQKGRGTFVAKQPERLRIPHFNSLTFSFLNLTSYEDVGLQPISLIEPNAELDEIFGFTEKRHPGYWLAQWPIVYDNIVHGWCTSTIPVQIFPDLGQAISSGKRMLDIKSNKYAHLPVKGSVTLLARPARNNEAQMLEIPRRNIVLAVEGPLFGRNGNACEFLRTALRTDMLSLEIN